jgi:hypothetical protein
MISIHATAQGVNAQRAFMLYLQSCALPATIVHYNDERSNSDATAPFIRIRLTEGPARSQGPHPDGGKATRRTLIADCECWVRGTAGEQLGGLDGAAILAGMVVAALTYPADIEIFDYVAGTTPPVTTGHYLQFTEPPSPGAVRNAPDGWQQVIVSTQAFWFARKE